MCKFMFYLLQMIVLFFILTNGAPDRCRIMEFRCSNTKCIPSSLKCNGLDDCGDNSDEICATSESFTCSNNLIIPKSLLCDGKKDCPNDEDPKICEQHKCPTGGFMCRTKPMNCIDINSVCNNVKDCTDESDESPEACEFLRNSKIVQCQDSVNFFRCDNKQLCIAHIFRCDKNDDCVDKSDEWNCSNSHSNVISLPAESAKNKTGCTPDEFYCGHDSPTGCISKDWYCDNSIDCANTGEDEKNCPDFKCPVHKPNKCNSIDVCYENEKRCDGFQNCADGSDEHNCDKPINEVICNDVKEFKCSKNNTCIDLSRVCDGINDCGDLSDERPGGYVENCKKTPCKGNNGDCEHICVSLYHTRKCLCKPGYKISPTNDTRCIDIDECSEEMTCSHKCTNLMGSYKCECFEGFYKINNNGSLCMAVGEKFLLYSTKNSIREIRLMHHYMEVISSPIDPSTNFLPIGIDFDYNSQHVFWTQFEPKPEIIKIQHSFFKTKSLPQISLVNKRIHSPVGLAYDWIHGLLFWTDIYFNEISVLNITNGMHRVLLRFPNDTRVRSIVVHPKYRRIYWTDWGTEPKIESMGMDGNDRKIIVKEGLVTPNGLALDYNFNELYWVDAKARSINSYNLKTGKQREVVTHLNAHGFDIDVFEDWIYLSDWHFQNIIQIHKRTGHQKILISSPKPMGVKLFHQLAQPKDIENVCSNNPCQYLCLPTAMNLVNNIKFRCLCPDDSYLLQDRRTCSPLPFEIINATVAETTMESQKPKLNIYFIVVMVTTIVTLVLFLVVLIGIAMYRNYMRRVIKRATSFNNPIYEKKFTEIQMINSVPLLTENAYSSASTELIPRDQYDDGLQMMSAK